MAYAPWCRFCQAMEPAYGELAAGLAGSHVRVAKFQVGGGRVEVLPGGVCCGAVVRRGLARCPASALARPWPHLLPPSPAALSAPSPPLLPPALLQADVERDFATERLGLKTFPTIVFLPKVRVRVCVRLCVLGCCGSGVGKAASGLPATRPHWQSPSDRPPVAACEHQKNGFPPPPPRPAPRAVWSSTPPSGGMLRHSASGSTPWLAGSDPRGLTPSFFHARLLCSLGSLPPT